jgi:ABC-type lipoprotein release transport system permease subunit
MRIESPPEVQYTIIGIVADARQILDQPPEPQSYRSYRQYPTHDPTLIVRSGAGSTSVAQAIRQAVKQTDTEAAIGDVRTFRQMIGQSVEEPRFRTLLLMILAFLALLLAAVGIYGVLAYTVKQRTNEIGIRVALGARQSHVFGLIIGHGMRLALAGTGLGLVGAFALTRVLKAMLFEIEPDDPGTFIVVSVVLLGIALLACWLPARRAAKVDPMTALRHE